MLVAVLLGSACTPQTAPTPVDARPSPVVPNAVICRPGQPFADCPARPVASQHHP